MFNTIYDIVYSIIQYYMVLYTIYDTIYSILN